MKWIYFIFFCNVSIAHGKAISPVHNRKVEKKEKEKDGRSGPLIWEEKGLTVSIDPSALSNQVSLNGQQPFELMNQAEADGLRVFQTLQNAFQQMKDYWDYQLNSSLFVTYYYGAPKKLNAMFYYQSKIRLGTGDGTNYENISQDETIIVHEAMHAVIDEIAQLENEGETGSINEGLADFLAANILDSPQIGSVSYLKADYKRSLINTSNVSQDFTGNRYNDSLAVSGTLWSLRELLGKKDAGEFALRLLKKVNRNVDFTGLAKAMIECAGEIKDEEKYHSTMDLLKQRGWNELMDQG